MTPEQKLEAFFTESAPPARDCLFEAEAARRIARRRAVFSVVAMIPWALATAVVLWGVRPLLPVLGDSFGALNAIAPGLAGGMFLAIGAIALTRRLAARS
jgi:hypothetical protein